MHFRRAIHFAAILALLLTARAVVAAPKAKPIERSVSTSRQFIVYGADPRLRGAMCDLAERTKTFALSLLQQRDDWKTPILIHVQVRAADQPEMPPARLSFSQTGFGLKLQLDLTITNDLNAPAIQREVLAALLLEWMYRNAPDTPAGTPYVQPPPWLVDGLLAMSGEGDSTAAADAIANAAAQNKIAPLTDVVKQQPELLEPSPRAVYRVYSGALVSLLSGLPDGRTRLARMLRDAPQAETDRVLQLQAAFPETRGDKPLAEEWKEAVLRLAGKNRYGMLSCAESERQLAALLTVQLQANTFGLEQYPDFLRLPNTAYALRRMGKALLLFSARANPLYAPITAEYERITSQLARRKTGKVTERLARLRSAREEINRRMSAIDDYMNWFEATQSRTLSGAFADYMRAAELSADREPRRRDPISVYLDAFEAQLQN